MKLQILWRFIIICVTIACIKTDWPKDQADLVAARIRQCIDFWIRSVITCQRTFHRIMLVKPNVNFHLKLLEVPRHPRPYAKANDALTDIAVL